MLPTKRQRPVALVDHIGNQTAFFSHRSSSVLLAECCAYVLFVGSGTRCEHFRHVGGLKLINDNSLTGNSSCSGAE
jgi:hypothetical protein